MPTSDYLCALRERVGHDLLLIPGVAAIVRDAAGRVLVHQRADDGRWSLPAGSVEPGETPADATVREVHEETGLRVVPERVVGVFSGERMRHRYPNGDWAEYLVVVFACRVEGGSLHTVDGEATGFRWCDERELAALGMPFPMAIFEQAQGSDAVFDPPLARGLPLLGVLVASVSLLASLAMPLRAQADSARAPRGPFSSLSLRAGPLRDVHADGLRDYWDARGGAEVEVSTPFPVGEVGVAVARLGFRGLGAGHPDFDATLVSLRWGASHRLAGPLRVRGMLSLGDFLMSFHDDSTATEGLSREQELAVGAGASVDVALARWLGVTAGGSWQRVLTRVPIRLATVSAGVRLSAPTPRWLRGVLE